MITKFALLLAASGGMLAAPTVAATYLPTGVQTNVSVATVTGGGWSQCYSSFYGTPFGNSSAGALANCSGDRLMLAARRTNSDTLLLLAQAPTADVTMNTGNGNVTHNANGVEWYYSEQWSWGFARGGDTVSRNSCDTNGTNAAERLCWHTITYTGGWRAGTFTGLNNSVDFERLIFVADGSGVIPEPASWAMLIAGFGMVGFALRRRTAAMA